MFDTTKPAIATLPPPRRDPALPRPAADPVPAAAQGGIDTAEWWPEPMLDDELDDEC